MDSPAAGNITSIDAYINQYPPDKQALLRQVRQAIRSAAPEAEERISYAMPTFHQKQNLIHFALFKHHLGLYPGAQAILHFAPQLALYKTSKGAIQLPLDQPIPLDLIRAITQWRVEQVKQL